MEHDIHIPNKKIVFIINNPNHTTFLFDSKSNFKKIIFEDTNIIFHIRGVFLAIKMCFKIMSTHWVQNE